MPHSRRGELAAPRRPRHPKLIAIGTSAGGPQALRELLSLLPSTLGVPVVIVQHMSNPMFTRMLVDSLNKTSSIPVQHAESGQSLFDGRARALLAPGNQHMRLVGGPHICNVELSDAPKVKACRPSVDLLFQSASHVFGSHVLGVVLTGMGDDGLDGARQIVAAGGQVIVQEPSSCEAGSMPRAVADQGLSSATLSLVGIADYIKKHAGAIGASAAQNTLGPSRRD